jgi:putative flippase GtrA
MKGFYGFTLVSGFGWLLDVGLTIFLVSLGTPPFWASVVGAGVAVTFVYVVSVQAIFDAEGKVGVGGFPYYVVWQICAIAAASALVALLAHTLLPLVAGTLDWFGHENPTGVLAIATGAAKTLMTPFTLVANFLFIRWLTLRLD